MGTFSQNKRNASVTGITAEMVGRQSSWRGSAGATHAGESYLHQGFGTWIVLLIIKLPETAKRIDGRCISTPAMMSTG